MNIHEEKNKDDDQAQPFVRNKKEKQQNKTAQKSRYFVIFIFFI